MKKPGPYKIVVLALCAVVIIESSFLIYLLISRPRAKKVPAAAKGRIAIVIDDWGYSPEYLGILDGIKYPVTAAVLPRLEYSQSLATELHARGIEVILHLPMEPRERYNLEKNTILTTMDAGEITKILSQDLFDIRYAVGVSNHMGSRATEDTRVMTIVLKDLKERGLFFLDSFVSSGTVCSRLAAKLRVRFARRDIFLDNEDDPRYIKEQINKLKKKARVSGHAVGIGHARKNTLEALKEVLPELKKEGYKLVFVSELAK